MKFKISNITAARDEFKKQLDRIKQEKTELTNDINRLAVELEQTKKVKFVDSIKLRFIRH